jgi:Ca2+-binding EF-hand superfamily protein
MADSPWLTGAEKKKALEEKQRTAKALDQGASDLPAFQECLVRKHGNIMRGWKEGLDLEKNGSISFMAFARACNRLGYKGGVKELWDQLDADGSKQIGLAEIAPVEDAMLRAFTDALRARYNNSLIMAWKRLLDPDNSGRCTKTELEKAIQVLRLDVDTEVLFGYLDYDRSGFITLEEVDQKAFEAMMRGDDLLGLDGVTGSTKPKSELTFFERQAMQSTNQRRQAIGKQERKRVETIIRKRREANIGASDLEGFQTALVRKHGNILRAWKEVLDVDGIGHLCFTTFCKACRDTGYNGNIKKLWNQLDYDGSGFISIDEIAPVQGAMMTQFKQLLRDCHGGSLVRAWKETLDVEKASRVSLERFIPACESLGISTELAYKTFLWLDYDHSGFISLDEIDQEAQRQLERGDDEIGLDVQQEKKVSPLELSFFDRQDTEKSKRYRLEKKRLREKLEAAAEELRSRDVNNDPAASFSGFLKQRFHTIENGWKKMLDPANKGSLTQPQFFTSCRLEGLPGNIPALWSVLDPHDTGELTFFQLKNAITPVSPIFRLPQTAPIEVVGSFEPDQNVSQSEWSMPEPFLAPEPSFVPSPAASAPKKKSYGPDSLEMEYKAARTMPGNWRELPKGGMAALKSRGLENYYKSGHVLEWKDPVDVLRRKKPLYSSKSAGNLSR